MNNKKLSIIIVNYNGIQYLKDCLESIKKYCSLVSYEVIMVDNLSIDGSQSYIKENYSEVILIENEYNLGFSKANNLGVKHAKGEIILLLNNDTILLNDFSPLLKVIKRIDVGAIGIKMLNSNKEYVHSFGKFPKPMKLLKLTNLNETRRDLITGNFTKSEYQVDWISGSFILVTKEDWNLVNGMDEDYFMYVEDVDFCKRLRNNNKQILFYPSFDYVHFVGFSLKREFKLIQGYKTYSNKHFSLIGKTNANLMLAINVLYKKIVRKI